MKRILSLFLSLALLLTLLTAFQVGALTAHAHDADDAPEAEASAVSEQPGEEDASAEPAPVPEESGEANTEEDNRPYCLINGKKAYLFELQAEHPDLSRFQLTEEQLQLPTEELVQLIIDSPMFRSPYLLSNSVMCDYDRCYEILRIEFNAIRELESRTDATRILLAELREAKSEGSNGATYGLLALLRTSTYKAMLTEAEKNEYLELTGLSAAELSKANTLESYAPALIGDAYFDGKELHVYQKDETDTVDTVETEAESDGEQVELQSFIPIYANGDDGFSYMEVSTNIRTMSGTPAPRPYEPEERVA